MYEEYFKKLGVPFAIILTGLCALVIYGNGNLSLTGFVMLAAMSAFWSVCFLFRRHLLSIAWVLVGCVVIGWGFFIDPNDTSPVSELLFSMKPHLFFIIVVLGVMTVVKFLFPFKSTED